MVLKKNKVWAIPPEGTIKGLLEDRNISFASFVLQSGLSHQEAKRLLNGSLRINNNIALVLEKVFGVDHNFWLNLENIYKEDLRRSNGFL